MEQIFQIDGKLKFENESVFAIVTEQDVYNRLRNKGFFDVHVKEVREEDVM